jgi:uncharacterized protein YprB with RNaseH-like and TPR domain
MLQNTFCHIRGIGPQTERRLWEAGVHSWQTALAHQGLALPANQAVQLESQLRASIDRLAGDDAAFFYRQLAPNQHWRIFREFRHSVAYLDIETTGLGAPGDTITTIALYDGQSIHWYVQGDNLEAFADDIGRYRLVITYNGKCFDLPFIRRYFRIPMDQAHIDLRYLLAGLGYRGGLKGCERQLGIDRQDLADLDGYFAVLLWHDYHANGNHKALETLLAYNILDVVNLETLMVIAYNLRLRDTPFAGSHGLIAPTPPPNPFRAHQPTIARLRARYFW